MTVLKLPENTLGRDFTVGDLHGRFEDLQEALRLANFDPLKDRIICCGDFIDRGPDSLALSELLDEPWFYSVRGNHEQMFLDGFSGFIDLSEDENPCTEKAKEYIYGAGGFWVKKAPKDELYRLRDRLQQLPLVIDVIHRGQRFAFAHAELPGGGRLTPINFDADLNRLEQDQRLVTWSLAKARLAATDTLDHRVEGVDYAIFGHTPATNLSAQGYFFRFSNRVYVDGSFVPASRLLLELGAIDRLPIYPKPQVEILAQDLPQKKQLLFEIDLPSGEKMQAQLQSEFTLPGGTKAKMKANSYEPLSFRQNLPTDLPTVGDLLDAAAKLKPWKKGGELRVVCDARDFHLHLIDSALKAHHESSAAYFMDAYAAGTLSLPRKTSPFTAPWRARVEAAGIDGRRLITCSDSMNFSRAKDTWLIEVLASLVALVFCGKHLAMDPRFLSWTQSLKSRGINTGWMPLVDGDSTKIEAIPQDIKSHANGLVIFYPDHCCPMHQSDEAANQTANA